MLVMNRLSGLVLGLTIHGFQWSSKLSLARPGYPLLSFIIIFSKHKDVAMVM